MRVVVVCMYVKDMSSLSMRSYFSGVSNHSVSPQKTPYAGTDGGAGCSSSDGGAYRPWADTETDNSINADKAKYEIDLFIIIVL